MQPGLFQKTIQRRNPKAVSGQKEACWPSPTPSLNSSLKAGLHVWKAPQNPGSRLQPARAPGVEAGLGSRALPTSSLDWFSYSPSETTRSRLFPPWPSA